jgi:chorismate synthase
VAKKLLAAHGITVTGYVKELAGLKAERLEMDTIESNIVRCPDPDKVEEMIARVVAAQEAGDSVGGVVEVRVSGMKPGLGDPVFDKLEARLAYGIMSIGSVKGFEVGIGFACTDMMGSQFNDPFTIEDGRVRTTTNNSGGILGGISTGEDVVIRAAIRPPASIAKKQQTVNWEKKPEDIEVHGRHDPSIAPRAVPVLEAMVAMTIADCLLIQDVYLRERETFGTLHDAAAIFDDDL